MNHVKKISFFATLLLFSIRLFCQSNQVQSLAGPWRFQIDDEDKGIKEEWFAKRLRETVLLPGGMTDNGKGFPITADTKWTGDIIDSSWFKDPRYEEFRKPGNIKVPFWLQPELYYSGAAWYQKQIDIPASWEKKHIELFLERCHWETIVWIDNQKIGTNNSLSAPHVYPLDGIKPGKHVLTILVDNRVKGINVGPNSHSVSDHTQGNWNGIIGGILLRVSSRVYFDDIKIFPDIKNKKAIVRAVIKNISGKEEKGKIKFAAAGFNSKLKHEVKDVVVDFTTSGELTTLETAIPMGEKVQFWSEFEPNLYNLTAVIISDNKICDTKNINFGMREFKTAGTRFTINGRPTFLRGTLECAIFPKTGYPPTNIKEWERILKVAKSFGLNHVRFHSWCPPEAAFEAADKIGIYFQIECASWANQGSEIGLQKPIDKWLYEESERIVNAYGNHPSFCMMAYGNEPAGEISEYLTSFVKYWKEKDSRRVYTSAAGWPLLEVTDYNLSPDPRIQAWGEGLKSIINAKEPNSIYDFQKIISRADKPFVSHEIGQWCVYPNFKEIPKYTGYLKAKNFEIFKESLNRNGLGMFPQKFLLASGKLQTLCYKYEIEAALRTPGFAGFQLLDLHDFPGQGTALVGVLDPFWEEKGYVTAKEYSRFCNSTVPLLRINKFVFKNDEILIAEAEVSHFGKDILQNPVCGWQITSGKEVLHKGKFNIKEIGFDNCISLGKISLGLLQFQQPVKITLEISVNNFCNSWDIWVYPSNEIVMNDNILISSALDDKTIKHLENGGKVLLSVKKNKLADEMGGTIAVGFSSIFWNTAWTGSQPPHTLGILCNPNHPALKFFPTEYFSGPQWWDAMSHSQAINIGRIDSKLTPIVRIIDDWFQNRNLAMIFEAKIGKGKIIFSGIDLITDIENRTAGKQLLFSLEKYMSGKDFRPAVSITFQTLKNLIKPDSFFDDAKVKADSYHQSFPPENAIDGNPKTFWHTPWSENIKDYPHELIISLGDNITFKGISCLPRQDGQTGGLIKEFEIYVSDDGINWGIPVSKEIWENDSKEKIILFEKPLNTRYIKLKAVKGMENQKWASLAELKLFQ